MNKDMNHYYRTLLADYSRRSFARGLVGGAGGNLSVRLPGTDTVLITPTGVSLEEIFPETSVLVDLDGKILESPLGHKGSKETGFHLLAYKIRKEVNAVVHLHPIYATAFSTIGQPLPLATVASRLIFKNVPCIPCFNPGSKELADEVSAAVSGNPESKAFIMQDHGVLAVGPDITTAYYLADLIEHTAQVAFMSKQIKTF